MKVSLLNKICFRQKLDNKYSMIITDEGNIKRLTYDSSNRCIDTKVFDKNGTLIESMHKDFYGENFIEIFKNNFQEYTRRVSIIIKNNLKIRSEEFISKTSPSSNYINEYIYDLKNNLLEIINNGKSIKIKK